MTDTGGVTATDTRPAPPARSRRGRETVVDMVRSLAVVFLLVVPLWFFGQSSPGDSKAIRPVDAAPALAAFTEDTGAPAPTTPQGWVVNVARFDAGTVRVGYVIGDSFVEFAGGGGPMFLENAAGKGSVRGSVDVAGTTWDRFESTDGHESLVRRVGATTLVVGGLRENATLEQLTQLAATIRQ